MSRPYVFSVLWTIVLFGLTACGHRDSARDGIDPAPQFKAPPRASESFIIDKGSFHIDQEHSGRWRIGIKKTSLDKEFLLQASLIKQSTAPLGSGMKSRVVMFRKRDGRLFLVEATQGHTVTNDFPQTLLLVSFPILEETSDRILFDFNAGMSQLFVSADMKGSDEEGKKYKDEYQAVTVGLSYLDGVTLTRDNQLEVRQVAQLNLPKQSGIDHLPVEVRYFLSPYLPSASFKPSLSPGFDRMGFFEVAPQLGLDGRTLIRSTKWNLDEPIVFAISSNTPAEYREAVKDGILYWNTALSTHPIQVIDAPKGIRAPDPHYNVVQWIDWDTAGYAYADAQMDPRSGEILRAQVFIPSVFATDRKALAKVLLEKLKLGRPALRGFESSSLCELGAPELFSGLGVSLISKTSDQAKILKAAQDVIRYVVAHEIGHALGLRHNFAGNLGASRNYTLATRTQVIQSYLNDGKTLDGVIPSSSVMDYLLFEDAALTGDVIHQKKIALPYDQKAVTALYDGRKFTAKEMPIFCTDSHKAKFVDCQPFDTGLSAVEYAEYATMKAASDLPYQLIALFEQTKASMSYDGAASLSTIAFDPEKIAKRMFAARTSLFEQFTKDDRFVRIHRLFPVVGPVNLPTVQAAEDYYFGLEASRLGGVEKVFPLVTPDQFDAAVTQFSKLLLIRHSQNYFTDEETREIIQAAAPLFQRLTFSAALADLLSLAHLPSDLRESGTNGDALNQLLVNRVKEYTFASVKGDEISAIIELPNPKAEAEKSPSAEARSSALARIRMPMAGESWTMPTDPSAPSVAKKEMPSEPKTVKIAVKFPEYAYPISIRRSVSRILGIGGLQWRPWGEAERIKLHSLYVAEMQKLLGNYPIGKLSKLISVEPKEKTADVYRWLRDMMRVERVLDTMLIPAKSAD